MYSNCIRLNNLYMVYLFRVICVPQLWMILRVIKCELHVICSKRLTIAPFNASVQGKGPCLGIIGPAPTVCKPGYHSMFVFPGKRIDDKAHSDITGSFWKECKRSRISIITTLDFNTIFSRCDCCRPTCCG